MAGRQVEFDWHGRRAVAWVPAPLAERRSELDELSEATVRATERAAAAARRTEGRPSTAMEALGRLLLRAEGVASSEIEGLRAPLELVAVADLEPVEDGAAAWVADNLHALDQAVADVDQPLTVERLHSWHRRLMEHGHLPGELVGQFRDRPGWIGGTAPTNAVYVPPPADEIPELLDDLVAFANTDDVDPVSQAALLHAQFETIHPYGDGNGRIGRVLVSWLLARRLRLAGAPPATSVLIGRDPGGYLSGLTLFRTGPVDPWVRWFAGVVERAGEATVELLAAVEEVVERWEAEVVDLRADATARAALPVLAGRPVVTSALLAEALNVSERAALGALEALAERGVVAEFDPGVRRRGGRRRWFRSPEIVDLVATWPG